jgi:hypothetical protein
MRKKNLQHISSFQPTYWMSDMTKQPDLLDFCNTKGIAMQKISVESCLELTSGHKPIIVNTYTLLLPQPEKPSRYKKNKDCEVFRELIETQVNLKIPLKTAAELQGAVYKLTTRYNKQPGRPHRPQGNNTPNMTAQN